MNQKIVIVFSVFILSSLFGGFFLFKNQDILKQNPFLASIVKFKGAIVLSETDLIALKDKINFLESELSEKKIELEKIDDLSEENDLLSQRIIELYWEIESLELAVFEAEQNKIQQELEEELEDEEEQIEEELEADELEESEENLKNKESCVPGEININIASSKDLQKIVGIGSTYAQNIIKVRPFCSIDDLLKVAGIGERTLQKIKEQGCAYVPTGVCPVSVFVPVLSGGGGGSSVPQPQILLSFPLENPVNKEIEVDLSVLNLKNSIYDIKISIEKDEVISDTYNDKEEAWQNSYNYVKEFFSGNSFNGKIKLKIKEAKNNFLGEADVLVKIRETSKSSSVNYSGKINITEAELEPIKEYNLTINIIGEGTTNPEVGTYVYQDLEEVNITAFPSENWEFAGWTGDQESKESEINIVMDQDKTITANFQEKEIVDPEPDPDPQNLLLNEFFDEWQENGESADDLIDWNYGGTSSHIIRSEDAYFGNYSAQWKPITSANNLTQTNINISESGDYFAEIWIKPINVDEENYIRVSLDIADPLDGSFSSADFTNYTSESGWVKISKTRNLEMGESGGIRIRSHRQGSGESGFLIGGAWLGTTEPPDDWPN